MESGFEDMIEAARKTFCRSGHVPQVRSSSSSCPVARRLVAACGRLNVGKSLLNAPTGLQRLARTSNNAGPHPGAGTSSTSASRCACLVDMPGYGFCQGAWAMVRKRRYLRERLSARAAGAGSAGWC